MSISLKRAYEPPGKADGMRVLVDRLWPRGVTKSSAKIDLWVRDLAPSAALRKWFGHEPEKWPEFQEKYRVELQSNPALSELKEHTRKGNVTLVYAAKDEMRNGAVVLKQVLGRGA